MKESNAAKSNVNDQRTKTFLDDVFPAEVANILKRTESSPPSSTSSWHTTKLRILKDFVENSESAKNELAKTQPKKPNSRLGLVGLAFSGGGIRSATFNLGILQGMASIRTGKSFSLLRYFDYLSTVSGGGYIGSWFTAWVYRQGIQTVEEQLLPCPLPHKSGARSNKGENPEPNPIQHLRDYSNYLTPKLGLSSLDTWTAIVTYLRNLILTHLVLLPLLSAVVLLPRIFSAALPQEPPFVLPLLKWNLQPWGQVTWAIPLLLILLIPFYLLVALIIGKVGSNTKQIALECWAQLGGWPLRLVVAWVGLCVISFYGPLGFELLQEWGKATLTFGWIVTTVAGLFAAKSPHTGGPAGKPWMEYIAKIFPVLAMVGLMIGISFGVNVILDCIETSSCSLIQHDSVAGPLPAQTGRVQVGHVQVDVNVQEGTDSRTYDRIRHDYWEQIKQHECPILLIAWIACIIFAMVMGCAVDINQFSMNPFYRNRLIQCYLRASRLNIFPPDRLPGFDPEDDLHLSELSMDNDKVKKKRDRGPYLLINTTLNLTKPKKLGWQERKAASFLMSPLFCGSSLTNYRETKEFLDNISLGTAFAISGAAFTSNMGYHSSPPVAFFLSLFNVRLGWWAGNPKQKKTWKRSGPRWGLRYLFSELLEQTSDDSRYVYLSDGGHFDNLGIYELVRRRCKYIVCCDAGADPTMNFEDLGNAIRKIRIDLGIDIEIDLSMLRRKDGQRDSQWHHAFGTIRYDMAESASPVGTLVYVKASLTGDEPEDVLEYATVHKEFPHESTLDQFFTESQFESYRHLGEHIAKEVFRHAQPSL